MSPNTQFRKPDSCTRPPIYCNLVDNIVLVAVIMSSFVSSEPAWKFYPRPPSTHRSVFQFCFACVRVFLLGFPLRHVIRTSSWSQTCIAPPVLRDTYIIKRLIDKCKSLFRRDLYLFFIDKASFWLFLKGRKM